VRRLRASFLKRAGIGFLMGMAVGDLISWLTGAFGSSIVSPALLARMNGEAGAIVVQTLLSGLYGMATMGGTVLYDIERWPLALATAVHCLIVAGLYAPIALLLGWAAGAADVLVMVGILLAAFFLIWLVMYLRYKAQVRGMNEMIQKRGGIKE